MKKIIFIGLFLVLFLSFISAVDCGAGKKFVYQKMGSCDSAKTETSIGMCVDKKATGCVFAIPGNNPACWNPGQVASYDNGMFYYDEGKLMGWDINSYYRAEWYSCICENNTWVEASDNNKQLCEAQIGVSKTLTFLNPIPKQKWMENFCCGDDCFEFYKKGEDGTSACCNSPGKIVINGKCLEDIHDVKVEMTISPNTYIGNDVNINSVITNLGNYNEDNISVKLYADNVLKSSQAISVEKSKTKNVNFVWKAIEGIHNLLISAQVGKDNNLTNNNASVSINVTSAPYQCADSDRGLNYEEEGKTSLQISPTRIRSYKDGCKNNPTDFLGNFDNNIGPGGGPVIKNKITNYLYEAICKEGKPAMVVHECNCLNGKCV